jgi:hypothetical protein
MTFEGQHSGALQPDPNPFRQPFDFEEREPFVCPRCKTLVPYEERRLSVRERVKYYFDPINWLFDRWYYGMLTIDRESKWVCSACFEDLKKVKRRALLLRILVAVFNWGFLALLVTVWFLRKKR